ncbi:MAG: helicase-related protein [Solibacillus sp.]
MTKQLRTPPATHRYQGLIVEPQIRNFFTGRIWSRRETPFPQEKINTYIQHRYFELLPAVLEKPIRQCRRCFNTNNRKFVSFHCVKCQKICHYCRHCITMGRMCSCDELLLWKNEQPEKTFQPHTFHWQGQLTKNQARAAQQLTISILQKNNHLIHAVCGAGKTEILFPAVFEALRRGKRVCIATPRTDVVLELFPRFQQVFPTTCIHAYYGNAPQQQGFAQLVLATTHQLYRFENAFDVMIVDEADAFPYTMDEALQQAVIKAKKQEAPTAYVTATPSATLLSQKTKGQWGYSFIARRFHGQPLPIPTFQALWNYEKAFQKGKVPAQLLNWLQQKLANNEPFLIFFPTIDLMDKAIPLFQQIDASIASVHAEDADRKEKVLQLRNEQRKGLLTTTILERGITIKNVQVAVVGAESPIFTASALIQISGRVGRNKDFPDGDIVFFHHGITAEMDLAKKRMLDFNRQTQ